MIREVETQIKTPESIRQAEIEMNNYLTALNVTRHRLHFEESFYQDEKELKKYIETLNKVEEYATLIEEYVMEIRNKIDGKMQLVEWQKQTGKEPKLI